MFTRVKKKTKTITAENFSPGKARLWTCVNNLKENYCVYILDATYDDSIESFCKPHYNSSQAVYYKNEDRKQQVQLFAVKELKLQNCRKSTLCASPLNYLYLGTYYTQQQEIFVQWNAIEDTEEFYKHHYHHRLLYLLNQLNEITPVKDLRKKLVTLRAEGKKGIFHSAKKADAIKQLVDAIDDEDIETFIAILQDNNEIFEQLTQPRPITYDFFFFGVTALAPSFKDTKTYKLLTKIKESQEFQNLIAEYNQQNKKINYTPF